MITMDAEDLRALLSQPPTASHATHADTERLLRVLEGEPEVDQHEHEAGAAAAVIERLHGVIDEWRTVIGDAAGCNPAWALDVMADRIRELRHGRHATDRLAAVLGSYTDTSFDALLDEVRELKAQLGRRTAECMEAKAKNAHQLEMAARMDEGARRNMAEALGGPELTAWGDIGQAARELRSQLDRRTPEAVPVLSVGDADADGVEVIYRASPEHRFEVADKVLIGEWRYMVTQRWQVPGHEPPVWGQRLSPIDGAPVIPTGDGLTIARVTPQTPLWTEADTFLFMPQSKQRLALTALIGDVDGEGDADMHIVAQACLLIARLKDERARHEQRRLDLAEKMSIIPATWDNIATHAGFYGLLSTPVLRMALAMQATIDLGHEAGSLNAEYDVLESVLSERIQNGRAIAPALRVAAVNLAVYCMSLTDGLGDLDTFDVVAEIRAARAKPAD